MTTDKLITEAEKWLKYETGGDFSNLSTRQAAKAMAYFHQHLLKQCSVSGSLPPDEDDGWMYCPNCGRVKIQD